MSEHTIIDINITLIEKYYGYTDSQLAEMTFGEILFLHKESLAFSKEDAIAETIENKVSYWNCFFTFRSFFLNNGFEKEEVDMAVSECSESDFLDKVSLRIGEKPNSTFNVLHERGGRKNVYHVPASEYRQQQTAIKIFKRLINEKLPFLQKYELLVYSLTEKTDIYIETEHQALYIPIQALLTCDSEKVRHRMVDYFERISKGIHGSSESILKTPTAVSFLKDLDDAKQLMTEQNGGR